MFAIKCTKGKECGSYVAIDSSCGYPYWDGCIARAEFFKTKAEAKTFLSDSLFQESSIMCNGTEYPPHMIHNASGVYRDNVKADYAISIVEITETVIETPLSGTAEIKYNAY